MLSFFIVGTVSQICFLQRVSISDRRPVRVGQRHQHNGQGVLPHRPSHRSLEDHKGKVCSDTKIKEMSLRSIKFPGEIRSQNRSIFTIKNPQVPCYAM